MWSEDYTKTDELNPGCISYSVIDEWHAEIRLWGKAMWYLSANILVMRYLQINSWTAYVFLSVSGVVA